MTVGDLNGDGHLDTHHWKLFWAECSLYDGTGHFPTPGIGFGIADDTEDIAVGDVDGDGDLDIIAGNASQNVLYINNGTGDFSHAQQRNFGPEYNWARSVAIGDMDGDGDLDIIIGNDVQDFVYLNDGTGNFPSPSHSAMALTIPEVWR